jgi:hypothetical protein
VLPRFHGILQEGERWGWRLESNLAAARLVLRSTTPQKQSHREVSLRNGTLSNSTPKSILNCEVDLGAWMGIMTLIDKAMIAWPEKVGKRLRSAVQGWSD